MELFWETDPAKILEELADVLEVIRSTCKVLGRTPHELEELAALKRKERGGFEEGLVLIETEEVPLMSEPVEESLFPRDNQPFGRGRVSTSKAPMQVQARKDALHISLIPPVQSGSTRQIRVSLSDFDLEAVVTYKNKEIRIAIRKPVPIDTPGQLTFEFPL